MYKRNENTGTISLNGTVIPMDDSSPLYAEYVKWLELGGEITETDVFTQIDKEILIQRLKEDYSAKISRIKGMREALERFAIDGTPINEEIVAERARMKAEYDAEVATII